MLLLRALLKERRLLRRLHCSLNLRLASGQKHKRSDEGSDKRFHGELVV